MKDRIEKLKAMATQLRRDVVNAIYYGGDGHPGPSMSIVDIITPLYFDVLRMDPENPKWLSRDRFILSKGHACPALYAALARKGFYSPAWLKTLRQTGSKLQGHPVPKDTLGVEVTAGSLGHGLPQACGMALASRKRSDDNVIFVLTGDGELNEGIVWESAMTIAKYKLTNVIAVVDNNGIQSGGKVDVVGGIVKLREKWEAFGWYAVDIDGHDMESLLFAFENAAKRGRLPREQREGMVIVPGKPAPNPDQPIVFIAKTIKGKGLPYMENNNAWHKRVPTVVEHELAMSILGGLDLE